ncbi:MAG: DNA-deoxyinosine glycosylase [Clostridiales bacterium]|jgi:TDG/mug DNA glycosylase family protein|nr:DNA-deoxyinosine glycosylase [Clostridiales bacterium]
MQSSEDNRLFHKVPPIYDAHSRVLILGTFPSPKSREASFFYSHPSNRFWPVMARIFGVELPQTVRDKRKLLLDKNVALWDVVASCTIENAKDSSIRNCEPHDLSIIFSVADIAAVFTTGAKAYQLYNRLCLKSTNMPAIALPSTSAANAKFSLDQLVDKYSAILQYL